MIDIPPANSVSYPMRRIILTALSALLIGVDTEAQTAPAKSPRAPAKLPDAVAEPQNAQSYAPPVKEKESPTAEDLGPVQKHFVLSNTLDDPDNPFDDDRANLPPSDKIALDKRITIPVIHDVENDSSYKKGDNHALDFEIDYLNWGAVTQEQLKARQGHYFTITLVNGGPKSDLTTEFEYRQVKSKEIIRKLTQKLTQVSGSTRAYFAVVNQAYLAYGPVCSWRFTVRKGDTIVAEAKSFIW